MTTRNGKTKKKNKKITRRQISLTNFTGKELCSMKIVMFSFAKRKNESIFVTRRIIIYCIITLFFVSNILILKFLIINNKRYCNNITLEIFARISTKLYRRGGVVFMPTTRISICINA